MSHLTDEDREVLTTAQILRVTLINGTAAQVYCSEAAERIDQTP